MKTHVTVVPSDNIIIVDGYALHFSYPAPANMHALQWHDGAGHIEWTDDYNHPLSAEDYTDDVAPFVALWEAEKARLDEEAATPFPEPTLEEAKAAKLVEINTTAEATLAAMTASYPQGELLTFDKQENEARAWLADNTTSTPLLSALAAGRGIPLADLVQKVIAKADVFSAVSGHIIGQRQGLEDRLDAAKTVQEVQAIEVSLHLPAPELGPQPEGGK